MKKQAQREDTHVDLQRTHPSLVHFFPTVEESAITILPLSQFLSYETPLSFVLSSPQISRVSVLTSTTALKSPKSTTVHRQLESKSGVNRCINEKSLSVHAFELAVTGEGEDYFQSLFGDPKKSLTQAFQPEKAWKHFAMILKEVSQSRSSAIGDIKIAEVNAMGLYVKLINSSLDKEVEIGNHFLQQNVNGQRVSVYQFLPNIIMQANTTVTVWAAASEGKHRPPSDFLWKEENKFITSPNCTTILCKPNGEAIAWYTPIHWKQAWEKLESDSELDRTSIVSPTSQRYMFYWPEATTTTKNSQDHWNKDTSKSQMEPDRVFLKREKEVPPTLFPNRSPWCHSPNVSPHPYCPLIEPHNTTMARSNLNRRPRSQSTRPSAAEDSKIQV
ncbi:lamin tail domain-containing protein 1 isoform X3 [Rousettus aegyptiacus]|uniref:Lamin tail domain containing 1 n=2 Tax=Rousettus aegyptiacus TaxID=9407 RepID=A0A7J8JG32_ROUAE|nr:lamin tail domain-containing protein 1 isoform X3 [Rousettus aegyptiacus]KAF6495638.1 lamin tail domain containing 1 [Rousettus aegyptiacus]